MLVHGFYAEDELSKIGLARYGKNVLISKRCSIYGASRIHLGNHVRIDDFCVLSAGNRGIYIGDYVHIAVYSSLIGVGRIGIADFCNISSKVAIYSSNDDYSGKYLTNPIVPSEYTNIISEDVFLGKHVIVGTNSTILPGTMLKQGVCIGAYSLVKNDCDEFGIYVGIPVKKIKERSRDLLKLEMEFLNIKG